jgi:putative zinc finger protein
VSRFPRLRRQPDQWADAHERARVRAAERLDGPLGLTESTWLDEHLAGCPSCAAIAAAYASDRKTLRSLRDQQPEPPRDLWARTAAAIEQLSIDSGAAAGDAHHGEALPARGRGLRALPLGAMSAVAVVVVVVGATLLSNGVRQGQTGLQPAATGAQGSPAGSVAPPEVASGGGAEPTPFAVGAGDVAWVDAGPGGLAVSTVQVEQVCPAEGSAGCPAVQDRDTTVLGLTSTPRTLIGSPSKQQAVAIGKAPDSADEVVVVDLPRRPATASPSPTPARTVEPTGTPSTEPSVPPDSAVPSPSVTVQTSESPSLSPEPTKAAELAIARGILVVGESAAFSADGAWFAFTARPSDGSRGPDVWVWKVGDPEAKPLTDDGVSYFASWSGDRAVVSRPADPAADTSEPASLVIDPATGDQRSVGEIWRPMVDPSGRFAIGWRGTLEHADDPLLWTPARGRLELRAWSADGDTTAVDGPEDQRVVADSAHRDFDVRWDESGEWVAVWIGDDRDAATGRLTLYHLDTQRQRFERAKGAPVDARSLPGFSIGSGRLAWATPRGQGGEGSRVQIAAWAKGDIGIVESSPGEDVRIIR